MTKFWIVMAIFYTGSFGILFAMRQLVPLALAAAPFVLILVPIWIGYLGPEDVPIGALLLAIPLFTLTAGVTAGVSARLCSHVAGWGYLSRVDLVCAAAWFAAGALALVLIIT